MPAASARSRTAASARSAGAERSARRNRPDPADRDGQNGADKLGTVTARIDELLELARARLQRVEPTDLAVEVAAGALVVDIRPDHYRADEGELPGALVLERNVLEWRLDPTSDASLPEAGEGRRVILFCNDGYASSLAAVSLIDLGLADATDLAGGYRAWRKALTDG